MRDTMQRTEKKIQIQLNGAPIAVVEGISLGELVDSRGLERRMIAVEYNTEIIPRYDYDDTTIQDGDRLEIVHMVGGG
jgi:thiamine biosynthesis protein ThiS